MKYIVNNSREYDCEMYGSGIDERQTKKNTYVCQNELNYIEGTSFYNFICLKKKHAIVCT